MLTKLVDVSNDYKEQCKIVTMMRDDEGIREVFSNRIDRLANSRYSFIVRKGTKNIGFVNLVIEKQDPTFYFLDIGLKEYYRNMGIGTHILSTLRQMEFDKFIILEVKADNKLGNASVSRNGVMVMQKAGINYYLLQKDRVQEFIDNDYLEKLANHVAIKSKKDLLKK